MKDQFSLMEACCRMHLVDYGYPIRPVRSLGDEGYSRQEYVCPTCGRTVVETHRWQEGAYTEKWWTVPLEGDGGERGLDFEEEDVI